MLALISLSAICTGAVRLLRDGHLVDITSSASNVKYFFFMRSIRTEGSLSIDQKHTLSLGTIQALKVGMRSLLAKDSEALLLALLSACSLWLAFNACQGVLSSEARGLIFTVRILVLRSIGDLALLGGKGRNFSTSLVPGNLGGVSISFCVAKHRLN